MKDYVKMANDLSRRSFGDLTLGRYALTRNETFLETLIADEKFDIADRQGAFLIGLSHTADKSCSEDIGVLIGNERTVLRAALCLTKVMRAIAEGRQRKRPAREVLVLRFLPANLESPQPGLINDHLSFDDFVEGRRNWPCDRSLAWFTSVSEDDDDQITGAFYGDEEHQILVMADGSTDEYRIRYNDLERKDDDEEEMEALAYCCYLHSKGLFAIGRLEAHFGISGDRPIPVLE